MKGIHPEKRWNGLLICFSILNLMLGCLSFKNLMNLVPGQKQQEFHQHILILRELEWVNHDGSRGKF